MGVCSAAVACGMWMTTLRWRFHRLHNSSRLWTVEGMGHHAHPHHLLSPHLHLSQPGCAHACVLVLVLCRPCCCCAAAAAAVLSGCAALNLCPSAMSADSSSPSSSTATAQPLAFNEPAKSASSLLHQLTALQAKHESLLKAHSSSSSSASSPTSSIPLDTVLPHYTALLTPLSTLTPSSPLFSSSPSSPLLVDGLLGGLNRYREIKGSMQLVLLHLRALHALASLNRPYARLMGQKPVVLAIVGTMKVGAALPRKLTQLSLARSLTACAAVLLPPCLPHAPAFCRRMPSSARCCSSACRSSSPSSAPHAPPASRPLHRCRLSLTAALPVLSLLLLSSIAPSPSTCLRRCTPSRAAASRA